MKTIQQSERQTHRHSNTLAERGFGFTDDHDRVPVEWFRYPDDDPDEFTDDGITDMPLTTKEGGLRQKRTNGAAVIRPVFPVDGPDAAARFVQFLIDQKYAPAATAALFITVGIERRFNYRVAADVGVSNHRFSYWLRKARRAMTAETVPVPPIDLPAEAKDNPRNTDYWRKTRNRRVGGEIRDAVKTTMRTMLEAEPYLSDAALARKLADRSKIAISRRTVAKYRMALGIRRQGALDDALTEAMAKNPKATDAELAAMLTASAGRRISAKAVILNRMRLGLRKNRPKRYSPAWRAMLSERQRQVHARNPASEETRRKMSESAKRRHALKPASEETRRKIAESMRRHWAKRHSKGA